MNYKDKVCKALDITVTDMPDGDVSIYTTDTQDGYELFVYSEDTRRVDISEDVFYYDDGLFEHIQEWLPQVSAGSTIYCSDEEQLMPDWLWEEIYDKLNEDK